MSTTAEAAPQVPVSIHNLRAEAHQQRQETIGESALWTCTFAIVQSGKVLWRQRWLLHVGPATRSAERRAEGQWWDMTHTPNHSPLLTPVVTNDLAFPSDTAWVNDGCVHIHDYTTVLLSCFLAARLNNSCPLCLHTQTHTGYVPCLIYNPRLCCRYTHIDPE